MKSGRTTNGMNAPHRVGGGVHSICRSTPVCHRLRFCATDAKTLCALAFVLTGGKARIENCWHWLLRLLRLLCSAIIRCTLQRRHRRLCTGWHSFLLPQG